MQKQTAKPNSVAVGKTSVLTFDDLVFEYQNKLFGAYQVRKAYTKHTFSALAIGVTTLSLLIVTPLIAQWLSAKDEGTTSLTFTQVLVEVTLPPQAVLLPAPSPITSLERVATIAYKAPVVTIDDRLVNDFADQSDLRNAQIGDVTQTGIETNLSSEFTTGNTGGGENTIAKEETLDAVFTSAEIVATFPGGDKALLAYLAANINYPALAKDAGVQGKVVLQFEVGKDGSITDVKVLRSLGSGTDQEAIRVVRAMPRWTPARQNGIPVRFRKTVPINFQLK